MLTIASSTNTHRSTRGIAMVMDQNSLGWTSMRNGMSTHWWIEQADSSAMWWKCRLPGTQFIQFQEVQSGSADNDLSVCTQLMTCVLVQVFDNWDLNVIMAIPCSVDLMEKGDSRVSTCPGTWRLSLLTVKVTAPYRHLIPGFLHDRSNCVRVMAWSSVEYPDRADSDISDYCHPADWTPGAQHSSLPGMDTFLSKNLSCTHAKYARLHLSNWFGIVHDHHYLPMPWKASHF